MPRSYRAVMPQNVAELRPACLWFPHQCGSLAALRFPINRGAAATTTRLAAEKRSFAASLMAKVRPPDIAPHNCTRTCAVRWRVLMFVFFGGGGAQKKSIWVCALSGVPPPFSLPPLSNTRGPKCDVGHDRAACRPRETLSHVVILGHVVFF